MTSAPTYNAQETDQTTPYGHALSPADLGYNPEPEIECLCPFCGTFNAGIGKPCSKCQLEDTAATRAATRQRLGGWHVLQSDKTGPAGMTFDALLKFVKDKLITSRSVVRGPATGQLWRLASKIRGLSRELGNCYSCGGDLESTESVCPHCERVQTVADHSDFIPRATTEQTPVAAENNPKVREALLAEPTIRVHSISGHIDTVVDPIAAARPVVAERSEHRIPKDDLLTPRDVAKAFQLEFGLQKTQIDRQLYNSGHLARRFKMVLSSVAALAVAFALIWPLIHVVPEWVNANAAKAGITPQPNTLPTLANKSSTDAQLAREIVYPSPPTAKSAPATVTLPDAPVILTEPANATSVDDDPILLWNAGLTAEASRNYSAAVQAYEKIQSLPSTMWPAQIDSHLALARKALKAQAH